MQTDLVLKLLCNNIVAYTCTIGKYYGGCHVVVAHMSFECAQFGKLRCGKLTQAYGCSEKGFRLFFQFFQTFF